MPVLFLMRHGEAENADRDFDRALTPKGRRDAQAQGARDIVRALRPGRILCSPARRTRETAAALTAAAGFDAAVEYRDEIYDAAPGALYELIKTTGDDVQAAGLIGHNPGIHAVAAWLAGDNGDAAMLHDLRGRYMPGTVTILEFEGRWADLAAGRTRLTALLIPG